jgi:GAF domain-containing protein
MPYIVDMDVVTGTDTSTSPAGVDRLLVGIRHLTGLADAASSAEAIFRALADELLSVPGAEEVHVHHLAAGGHDEDELVVVYLLGGVGRLCYMLPRAQRPPGVSWVAGTRRSFLASDPQELAASVPRLTQTGAVNASLLLPLAERGEVEAVIVVVRREGGAFASEEVQLAAALVEQAATALGLARAPRRAPTPSPAA